ncbi:MAG: O-methyltransferase [Pirellulales bacterium]
MGLEKWTAVDQYISGLLLPPDAALDEALAASAAAGLPAISVSPIQGKFLQLLARMCGATRILEIGTLGGYSTIWLARALPSGGKLVTLEIDPHHAAVAMANFERAGLADRIELRLGPARETLAALIADRVAPFDFVFIDADKPSAPQYFSESLALTRPGSVIIVDNVVRDGAVLDANSTDENVQGVRRLLRQIGREPRVTATALQTVGLKGYDGFVIARALE